MPSVSSAQQAIMGQAWAVRIGEMKLSEVAPKYRKEVSSIAKGEIELFLPFLFLILIHFFNILLYILSI